MKKIKKLLLPLASIAVSSTIVAPLLTSCSKTTAAASTEIPRNYTPSIEKHAAAESMHPDTAGEEYMEAIKQNPNIISEDFKFSAGQMYELVAELLLEDESNPILPPAERYGLGLTSFKAGLTDLSFNDKGQYTYRNGMTGSGFVKFYVDMDYILPEYKLGEYDVEIRANNLGYETKFINFDKFDITHESSLLGGGYTLIKPVFPLDLTDKNWAVDVKLFGDVQIILNNEEIINTTLDFDTTFNYSNILLLFTFKSMGRELIDFIQEAGSFASYYMSDVTCANRIQEKSDIVRVEHDDSNGEWNCLDSIEFDNVDKLDPDYLYASNVGGLTDIFGKKYSSISFGGFSGNDETLYTSLTIYDSALPVMRNNIDFVVGKYREDDLGYMGYTAEWKERHSIQPQFVQKMTYTSPNWASPSSIIYTYGTLCEFNLDLSTQGIAANDTFYIAKNDALNTKIPFINVKVSLNGTELGEEDYEVNDDYNIITFKKAIPSATSILTIELSAYGLLSENETAQAIIAPAA